MPMVRRSCPAPRCLGADFKAASAVRQCPTCNQGGPDNGKVRLTVLLPPRPGLSIIGRPSPQRKVWVMPVIKTIAQLRPRHIGPYSEFLISGQTYTGNITAPVLRRCSTMWDILNNRYICRNKRTVTAFNALGSARIAIAGQVRANLGAISDGVSPDTITLLDQYVLAIGRWPSLLSSDMEQGD